MRECIQLARKAEGKTDPNPMVGCVLVGQDGEVIGRGFHPKPGEPHAEIFALMDAGVKIGKAEDGQTWTLDKKLEGVTAYVSLEPCNHVGRTPPCSKALVQAGIARAVVGMIDPDPRVSGGGVQTLLDAGVEVKVGVEEEACKELNEGFIARVLASLRADISV